VTPTIVERLFIERSSGWVELVLRVGGERRRRFLTEPEVPKDGEHHDHDADDVEDVHTRPPFAAITLVVTDPPANWI
jgi:hypothetical protein